MLKPMLADLREPEVTWCTFVPTVPMRNRIFEIVQCTEVEEQDLARAAVEKAEEQARQSKDESFLATARLARLALKSYGDRDENLLGDAEEIARQIAALGSSYVPDVAGLYNVYRVWLRRAANFWYRWVDENRNQYDPKFQLPSYFPLYEGPLAVSRQIEWAVSRGDTVETLTALHPALQSNVPRDRFAAAQLIEWSERTKSEPSYWRFGGGSGPQDAIPISIRNVLGQERIAFAKKADEGGPSRHPVWDNLKGSNFSGGKIPPSPPPPPGETNAGYERQISFWIAEREEDRTVPLKVGTMYSGRFRVGVPVAATLFGGEAVIPDSAIPINGLNTHWRVIPTNLQFTVTDAETLTTLGPSGALEFDLLVPKIGNSKTVSLGLTPQTTDARILVLIFVGQKLYRELSVTLRVTEDEREATVPESVSSITSDQALARLSEADLLTTHEWTTPPGSLTLYVLSNGVASIFGTANGVPYPPGEQIDVGTQAAGLSGIVDSLRNAAESLRKSATPYFNDIDPTDLLNRLTNFQPQYDWGQLSNFADVAHEQAWASVATSKELNTLAFYGRRLYDTLFPAESNSRAWMGALPPGQLVHVVWRQKNNANWIPHLPWELLYCGDVTPGAPIDPTQFWGLRYRLQYTAYDPPKVPSASLGTPQDSCWASVLFFGSAAKESNEVQWQRQVWTSLAGQIKSCLVPAGTTDPKSEVVKALIDPDSLLSPAKVPAAVLYLFCHYGKDPNNTPILRFGDTMSAADILTEPELGTSMLSSRPLVFANACATAGTDVYSANTVTQSFFARGCRAFIGTDCMIPSALASRFAIIFFYFFLRLADKTQLPMAAGEAVAQSRLFLWCQYRNIGGLLYSFLNQYELYMASDAEIRNLQRG